MFCFLFFFLFLFLEKNISKEKITHIHFDWSSHLSNTIPIFGTIDRKEEINWNTINSISSPSFILLFIYLFVCVNLWYFLKIKKSQRFPVTKHWLPGLVDAQTPYLIDLWMSSSLIERMTKNRAARGFTFKDLKLNIDFFVSAIL